MHSAVKKNGKLSNKQVMILLISSYKHKNLHIESVVNRLRVTFTQKINRTNEHYNRL